MLRLVRKGARATLEVCSILWREGDEARRDLDPLLGGTLRMKLWLEPIKKDLRWILGTPFRKR